MTRDEPPRLVLIQAKDQQPKREDLSKLRDGFLDAVLPGRPGGASQTLRDVAATFRAQIPEFFKLDMYLTSSAIAQQNLQTDEDGFLYPEKLTVGDSVAEASYYVRDIKFLVENIKVVNNEPIDWTFHVDESALFEFDMGTRTVCAAIDGAELAKIFRDNRQNIFRKNPRYYLLTSAVNKKIKNSLLNESQNEFFLYNNGLTCVAHTVRVTENIDDAKVRDVEVKDFQIVNGCQTAASIWSAFNERDNLKNVRVLAKIVENPRTGSEADHMSGLIAERSNTQNPLRAEDWKSNDQRQQTWHELFRRSDPQMVL